MIKKKNLIFLLAIFFITHCSFDNKTGIWSGGKEEKERISNLEREQKKILDVAIVYSSDNRYTTEITLKENIKLSKPIKNLSWEMSSLNHQNLIDNLYLPGVSNVFLKKKIGKNKSSISKIIASPLAYKNNIIFSDSNGSIFSINNNGNIIWKKNIYKKIYKKIYKNLNFSFYQNNIYVVDNIGFIYAISADTGKILWIKNHGVPLKSNIKIFNNNIFLINQDNRILCLSTKDGSKIWDIRSTASFIKSQNFLSLAISKQGDVVVINSSGDLIKASGSNGDIYWSLNTLDSILVDATDFFKSSELVIDNDNIFFSTGSSFYSYDLNNGSRNWEQTLSSVGAPIISKKNIFFVTENGYFIIMNKHNGKIISAENILKILKKKKQNTSITGFVMGSGKIYSVTSNGYLISSSANSGKVESFKNIGDSIASVPIISNGKLYIISKKSRIFGLTN
tara:strand:- start:1200 stop:2552 length:1353 start_codon:yes stop_codon:yes gene_type:complete